MTPTERLDKFNMHHKKIAEIIVGCIGVQSRQVHWKEVVPMIAAYVNSEHDKVRNQAIDECIAHLNGYCNFRTTEALAKKLESLKTIR